MSLYNDKRIAWLKRVFPRVQEYALRKWLMTHIQLSRIRLERLTMLMTLAQFIAILTTDAYLALFTAWINFIL